MKEFDITVFGATSFVGRLVCEYLAQRYGCAGQVRWALAGRSRERLEAVRESLGDDAKQLELVVADAADTGAMRELCARTRVVVSTVGPYALYGDPLIDAVVATGTDYCDLTGEPQWVRRMIRRHESAARESGARIVHCCGFDAIPSDLGTWFLQQHARERFGEPCSSIRMRVKAMRGGFSGGTVASMINVIKELSSNPGLRRTLASPYCLCPADCAYHVRQHRVRSAEFDSEFGRWSAPFVMEPLNVRIVHRSNALSGDTYGDEFRYDEAVLTGRGLRGRLVALGLTGALAGIGLASAFAPTRWALSKLQPKPGTGPDAETRAAGYFDIRFSGSTARGDTLYAKVTGDRDPGYGSTSKMLGEAGACLALDFADERRRGGFWTPATMFGQRLVDRLTAHAGLTFEVSNEP